jgi:hypothetical protein
MSEEKSLTYEIRVVLLLGLAYGFASTTGKLCPSSHRSW